MLTPNGVTLSAYNTAVKAGARSHVRITFTAQNIVLEDVDLEASGVHVSDYLNGETELTFGKAVSKAVTMQILNSSKLNGLMWSSEFKLEIGLEVGGNTRWNTIGYFSGKRPEKVVTVDIITFNATDRMKKFDVIADAWLDSLTYPKTVWQMFTSLCDYVGIGYVSGDELANMKARSYAAAPIVNRGLTCRTILSAIAEACGCYAKINEDGNCQLVWFEDHTGDYTLTGDDEFSLSVFENVPGKTWEELEGYTWEDLENVTWEELEGTAELFKVDAVVVKQTEDDVGVAYPGSTNGRNYIIVDNPFLITADATEVNNYVKPLYDRLDTFGGYVPASVNAIGNALIESGDIINITSGSQVIRMPLFVKETVWNGALTDGYECTGDVNQSDITAETRERLAEGGRYHKFKNTVDQLYSELYDAQTGDITVLDQRTNAIALEVQDKYTIRSGIDIKAEGIEVTGGKYIKIMSGGTFDVSSTNLGVSSDNGYFYVNRYDLYAQGNYIFSIGKSILDVQYEIQSNINSGTYEFTYNGTHYRTYPTYWTIADKASKAGYISNFMLTIGAQNTPDSTGLGYGLKGWAYEKDLSDESTETKDAFVDFAIGHFWKSAFSPKGTFNDLYYSNIYQNSSRDIKHDIQDLPSMGERLDELKPVSFVYDNDQNERRRMGLIYEDTMEVIPEICTQDESNKAINYVELVPALLKEIQELRNRVKILEERE